MPASREAMNTALPRALGKPISPRIAAIAPSMFNGIGRSSAADKLASIAKAAAMCSPSTPTSSATSSSRSSRGSRCLCWRWPNPGIRRPAVRRSATNSAAARPRAVGVAPAARSTEDDADRLHRRLDGGAVVAHRTSATPPPRRREAWRRRRSLCAPRGRTAVRLRGRCSPPSRRRSAGRSTGQEASRCRAGGRRMGTGRCRSARRGRSPRTVMRSASVAESIVVQGTKRLY